MDQEELRTLEARCIQEQPPWCVAACPIHVDARSFLRQAASGNWKEAWNVLRRTMPFPGILGAVCEAPCEARCKRGEAGDAVRIGALEKYCVAQSPPPLRLQPLPAKPKAVAVVGAGLSGLTAAWDLGRKGYRVAMYDPDARLGDSLPDRYPGALTAERVGAELAAFAKLNVTIHAGTDINQPAFMEECRSSADAVFLSLETADPAAWGLTLDAEGRPVVESPWQTTGRDGVFAGGLADTAIQCVAEGRWGATSMDRFLQNVSPSAGRDKDGPYETRLFTSLVGVEPLAAVEASDPGTGYAESEARAEAARCLQCECLECVKTCAYLEHYKGYPKKYAREIYNNASIVMGSRQANTMINSCSLCGLCETVCPEDFAMQDLCLTARRDMIRRGKMPPSAHEFALLDMAFSQGDRFWLARNTPGAKADAHVFFPGCQLAATSPDQVARVYDHLRARLDGGVALMLGCCGAPALWAGRDDLFAEAAGRFRETWQSLGKPRVIAACSTCLGMFRDHLADVPAGSLWEVLETVPPEPAWKPSAAPAVHDPCTTRGDAAIQGGVRRLLAGAGVPHEEIELGGGLTECCGYGGLMQSAHPSLAREVARRRAERSPADYLTYCAMCRDNLAAVGKRAVHLLDLFFPVTGVPDPAARPRVGWSERQENRIRLRQRLLREIWNEDASFMEKYETIRLVMTDEVRASLDRRRILDSDVQQVVLHAEETGDRLVHPDTGRVKASFKPYKATFWVEYTPRDGAYEIHNAYVHRMEVVGGGRL